MTNDYLVPIKPAEPIENTIRFFNTMSGDNVEVLRISKDGITANPNVPVDEAASAVLRAVDWYIKQITQRKPLTDAQINTLFEGMEPNNGFWLSFARAIEAAHGIMSKGLQGGSNE